MTVSEVRQRYCDFFTKRGHALIPAVALVPDNDPTTLFVSSGMQPLLPYFLGAPHPQGTRVVNIQPCFRAEDIEEIGDNRHTTGFEMLGNWSFGDYFKREQLSWLFEFLTESVGLDPRKLYVTVFMGDNALDIPKDDEAIALWKELFAKKGIDASDVTIGSEANGYDVGMQGARIFAYDAKKNWWSRSGPPAKMPANEPGGPDSEVFYDFGTPHDPAFGKECHPNCDCGRFVEIGNSVFMQYLKQEDGTFAKLPKANVDFGGGLERIAAASVDKGDVFLIDTLLGTIRELEATSGKQYDDPLFQKSFRIIADHMKGAVFMIADGVIPSNTEQGYILRRLIRRAIYHGGKLGIEKDFLPLLVDVVVSRYIDAYPTLGNKSGNIKMILNDEEIKSRIAIGNAVKEMKNLLNAKGYLATSDFFYLYNTHGLQKEFIKEQVTDTNFLLTEGGGKTWEFNEEQFNQLVREHQDTSRAGSEKKFKGGLADHSDMSVKYHTATHLLHQALRDVLGPEAYQKGSNITPERLRFDFAYQRKMTDEEKKKVEDIVNQKIDQGLPVSFEIVPLEEAKRRGAIGLFEGQYGSEVKVYKIGEGDTRDNGLYSFEFCGGPHVENTSVLGQEGKHFKITKEEAISQGIRRIRAVLE